MDFLYKFINNNNIIFILLLSIIIIIFFTNAYNYSNCKIKHGGSIDDNEQLDKMVDNGLLTNEQKLLELKATIEKSKNIVTKNNNIYNNLLTNLSSTEEEIENAEANLDSSKNKLLLDEINLSLKNSLILLKKNKNPKKLPNLNFTIALNKSKQYNIQTIISFHRTKQLRKNTLVSPTDNFFKTELLNSIEESIKYAQQSSIKSQMVYTLCISSTEPDIIKHKADLNSGKNISKNLYDNILNIKNRIYEKYKLQDSIKDKLLKQKNNPVQSTTQQDPTELTTQINTKKEDIAIPSEEQIISTKKDDTIIDTISNLFNF
tara:strand:+ start:677 stop:1630 length:954 start_codon:yes stop_codon:yes gene_type:complete